MKIELIFYVAREPELRGDLLGEHSYFTVAAQYDKEDVPRVTLYN